MGILKLIWYFRASTSSKMVSFTRNFVCYCVEVVRIHNHSHAATWHTTLFGIYYCVEVVLFANHSHMPENYVISYDFTGF